MWNQNIALIQFLFPSSPTTHTHHIHTNTWMSVPFSVNSHFSIAFAVCSFLLPPSFSLATLFLNPICLSSYSPIFCLCNSFNIPLTFLNIWIVGNLLLFKQSSSYQIQKIVGKSFLLSLFIRISIFTEVQISQMSISTSFLLFCHESSMPSTPRIPHVIFLNFISNCQPIPSGCLYIEMCVCVCVCVCFMVMNEVPSLSISEGIWGWGWRKLPI